MAGASTHALQLLQANQSTEAQLPPLQNSQDVRRERASLEPSQFSWTPVWNRTHLSSYLHNRSTSETRTSDVDGPAHYRIIHVGPTGVSSKVNSKKSDVATIWANTGVEVLLVVIREDIQRIRARIKSPPGWITLQNLETNYRFAVKADRVITIQGVDGEPGINGQYEKDVHETDRGDGNLYPRYKQVGGQYFLRIGFDEGAHWVITTSRSGHPQQVEIYADSACHNDARPITLDSLPPTWPGAWRSAGRGLYGAMPALTVEYRNEGNVRRFPGKACPVLGVVRFDYADYSLDAEEVAGYATMGYNLLYRRISQVLPAMLSPSSSTTLDNAPLESWCQQSLVGAIQRLEQTGVLGIVADSSSLLKCQDLAIQASVRPALMSPLLVWLLVGIAYTKEDRFLILTNDVEALKNARHLLTSRCQLNLSDTVAAEAPSAGAGAGAGAGPGRGGLTPKASKTSKSPKAKARATLKESEVAPPPPPPPCERFLVRSLEDLASRVFLTKRGESVPTMSLQDAVVEAVRALLETEQDVKGILLDSTDLMAYSDALRSVFDLPVWDAVNLCELHHMARPDFVRFEVDDWMARLLFEIGRNEGRQNGPIRKIGILAVDQENVRIPLEQHGYASLDFEVEIATVVGLTRYLASLRSLSHGCEKCIKEHVVKWAVEGVVGITGDCCVMMAYQKHCREMSPVPAFMSPLMLGSSILAVLKPGYIVMVVTIDETAVNDQKDFLKDIGCIDLGDPRFVLTSCKHLPGFERYAKKGEVGDPALITPGVCGLVQKSVEEWPSMGVYVGAILIESPYLLQCSAPLRKSTGLPVYDAVTCCEFFSSARRDFDRVGINQWAYAWDYTIEEE
mmetsp:Transcript_50764/g.107711  ORF Transcript_50764/g.107711 Transcript_50764/m.107711 type:complete len:851 (+) Transcript_50764:162-2714(+)